MYQRIIENIIKDKIGNGKAIIIVGARQVGKTTLIKKILYNLKIKFYLCKNLLQVVINNLVKLDNNQEKQKSGGQNPL